MSVELSENAGFLRLLDEMKRRMYASGERKRLREKLVEERKQSLVELLQGAKIEALLEESFGRQKDSRDSDG